MSQRHRQPSHFKEMVQGPSVYNLRWWTHRHLATIIYVRLRIYVRKHCALNYYYRSESPSQVLLIIIQWLLSLSDKYGGPGKLPQITLAYDNMCNLDKMRIARKPLPLPPPFDMLWLNVNKIIDVFHFPNHIGTTCKQLYDPGQFKNAHPNFNTQAGEQTFAWISRYKRILCAMPKNHHLFYLHRMVRRRNDYTSRCYCYGRKPILPKKR